MGALPARRRRRGRFRRGGRAPSPRLLVGLAAVVTGALGLYRLMRGADHRTYAPEPDRLPNEPKRPVSPTAPPGA